MNNNIIDYIVLSSADGIVLANKVKEKLSQCNGWALQGGISFAMGTYGQAYSQAMIQVKQEDKTLLGPN